RQELVAQMDQYRATKREVEGAELCGAGVVDRHDAAIYLRAKRLRRRRKVLPARLVRECLRAAPGRVVERTLVVQVDGDHLAAATFHLERPEPVPGPDVETPLPLERLRQPVAREVRPQVEHAL